MMGSEIKIAISPCPNDTFIFGYLIEGKVPWDGPKLNFEFLDIQALNEAVLSKSCPYDLIKCSYALYPKIAERFDLFPIGAALGVGVGPLLVGQPGLPLDQRNVIYVPGYDTTAYQLFRRYGPKGVETKALRYDLLVERLAQDKNAAGVVIHESRFTYEDLGLHLLLDLGKAWEQDTQLPLPLGGPVISKSCHHDLKKMLETAIKSSLQKAWKDRTPIESLMKHHAQEMDMQVMASHIDLYVNEYSIDLGSRGRAAIEKLNC